MDAALTKVMAASRAANQREDEKIGPGTFRMKVAEYLSWEAYHGPEKGFFLGTRTINR
jgi:hypothetical protein